MPKDIFITSKQLAENLHLSHSHIRQLLRKSRIQGAVKVGRDWLIAEEGYKPAEAKDVPTSKALAKGLKFSLSYTRQLIREGKIKGVKIGRDWVVLDLEQMPYERQRKVKRRGR